MEKRLSFPIHLDKWDSCFFNIPIARLHISGKKRYHMFYNGIKDLLRRAKRAGAGFIFIRLEHPTPFYEKVLLRAGMKDCGEYSNLVHRWRTRFDIRAVEGYVIRPYKKQDKKKICNIAKNAFPLSYLYRSGFAKRGKIDLYHKVWLENQTKNRNYLIFVTERHGEIAGFVTMNLKNSKKSARMSLMAVHKKHRGQGLGAFMIKTMLMEAVRRKRDTHFRTQEDNRFAIPIYTKLGCRLLSREKMFFKKI